MSIDSQATTDLNAIYKSQVRPLLDLNEELRKLLESEDDIHVATIVVVGDQSHGKTSLVEALSGVVLPRGEGMKTKLPLFLQLRALDEDVEDFAEVCLRDSEDERKRIGLSEVAAEIDALTDQVLGEGVCDVAALEIKLTVYRSEQEDLNLIDLPGIVRTVGESGPSDIGERILALYQMYMTPSETVLLNVVAAGIDIGTSSSLQLSLGLDEHRRRTLVCLTKTDEYLSGFAALRDRIARDCDRYRLGTSNVFCVRNRSPTETTISHAAASKAELTFFGDVSASPLAEVAGLGRASLIARLATIQREKILESLPIVMNKAEERLQTLERELRELPVALDGESERQLALTERLEAAAHELARSRKGAMERTQKFFLYTRLSLSEDTSACFERMLLEQGLGTFAARLSRETQAFPASRCAKLENKEFHDLGVMSLQERARIIKVAKSAQDVILFGEQVESGWHLSARLCRSGVDGGRLTVCVTPPPSSTPTEYWSCIDLASAAELDEDDPSDSSSEDESYSLSGTSELGPKAGVHSLSCSAPCSIESVRVSVWLEPKRSPQSSCSRFEALRQNFAARIRTDRPFSYFLSKPFLDEFSNAYAGYFGHEGLPGSLPPHVAVDIARSLQCRLYAHADVFAEQVLQMSSSWHLQVLRSHFDSLPNSLSTIEACVRARFACASADLHRELDLARLLYDQVRYDDHYVSSLLARARQKVDEVEAGHRRNLGSLTMSRLQTMDNLDRSVLDEALRLAAYWKAMSKDYTMHVTRLIRHFYFSEKLELALRKDLLRPLMTESETLAAPDPNIEHRRSTLQARVAKLRKATNHGQLVLPVG